jgi:tetratricopeptide (TPR) repeat protein
MRRNFFICLLLAGLTLSAFWPVGHLGFIIYDDHGYVSENQHVQTGITADSVRWAFTSRDCSNWHPVTWLSHMLDCQLFGLNASGPHWVNLGFHLANTLLLFFVLRQMTAAVWCSAFVAALFALHPTHLQSVAWISERKDTLSAFFFLLTLWAYARYALGMTSGKWQVAGTKAVTPPPGPSPVTRHPSLFYGLALAFFILGLMSKPMLVTLPVILLLLDFWPLGRIADWENAVQFPVLRRLLWEKVPFVALSVGSSIVTFWAQQAAGAVIALGALPWYWRTPNTLVFYVDYLGKMFWPVNLAILYPYPYIWIPTVEIVSCGLLLLVLSVFCIRQARRQPWLLVGWFWFVVMLVPVIGLVQVGIQAMADRYTYLPSIGLFIAVAWSMAGVAAVSRFWRAAMVAGATALVLACLLDTRYQLRYWRDSVTLFTHTLAVTGENPAVRLNLGMALVESGDLAGAARNYRAVLKRLPDYEDVHYRLGYVLIQQERYEEARAEFGEVLRLNPNNPFARKFYGDTLAAQGKYAEAGAEYTAALELKPDDAVIRNALAFASEQVKVDQVLTNLYNNLKIMPTPEAHVQIAVIRTTRGDFRDAVGHYLEALRLKPDTPAVLNNLAWLLATCPDASVRDGAQAVKYAERVCELTDYKQTILIGTLAAAYAEAGRFDEAIATAEKACALASESGDQNLLKRNQELLERYRQHQPYHETQ